MKKKLLILAVLGCLLYNQGNAQSPGTESPALNPNPEMGTTAPKKRAFFVTPYYEFTHFKNLGLVEQTNYHSLVEGKSQDIYLQADLDEYNDHYGTEYQSGMSGLKVGYQVLNGLGISAYAGLTHFNFKSWVSDENTQYISTQYPALTLGVAVDYEKTVYKKLIFLTALTYNYCVTGTPVANINTSEEVLSSNLNSMFWELDLAMAYPVGRFLPFAGAGFTQQSVHSIYKVSIRTTDLEGNDFYNTTEFDSRFRGASFYGFAGIEYRLIKGVSMYLKSSFPNPLRSNMGFRIVL